MTAAAGRGPYQAPAASFEALGLSRRQADVLAYLLQGMPNKIIAREMHLSIDTIKDHVAAVLRALGVSSRTQAVLAISQMTQRAGGLGSLGGHGVPAWKRSRSDGES